MPVASKSVRKTEPKKRAKSSLPDESAHSHSSSNVDGTTLSPDPAPKPGRKTRGSKIVTKHQMTSTITTLPLTNIILNLKCSMTDLKEYNDKLSKMIRNPLEYNSSAPPEVKYYDGENKFGVFVQTDSTSLRNQDNPVFFANAETHLTPSDRMSATSQTQKNDENKREDKPFLFSFSADESIQEEHSDINNLDSEQVGHYIHLKTTNDLEDKKQDSDDVNVNVKDMSAKLKQLKIQLYKNTLHSEKKSACFWCTYDFDNAPCYIPKYEMDDTIYGYGSFCRPECAVAYLMKESIDDSTKFDRYQLLNQIYSKVYDCKKNIKPAPDPHYLLDKFYGNLNIQEYRRLLKTEHLLLVIDKPLTRILPELHEDTDDSFTKIYGIKATSGNSSGVYKVKRQSEQPNGPSKASIIKSTFGI
jgi:hypothetical protein